MARLYASRLAESFRGTVPPVLAEVPVAPQSPQTSVRGNVRTLSAELHSTPACAVGAEAPISPAVPFGQYLEDLPTDAVHMVHITACSVCAPAGSAVFELVDALEPWTTLLPQRNGYAFGVEQLALPSGPSAAPGWEWGLLRQRERFDFPTTIGVPAAHPDAVERLPASLRSWWGELFTSWSTATKAAVTAARATLTQGLWWWDGPLTMVTPNYGQEAWSTLSPCLAADAHADVMPALAVADCVGIIARHGQAPAPVLLVPATMPLHDSPWVSLGPPLEGADLELLLTTCSAAFTDTVTTARDVAAVRTALGLGSTAAA